MIKEHPTLKSLCGNRGDETELDMSGKMDGAGDAVMLVPDIIDNGALTSLNVSNNSFGVAAGWYFASRQWWLNGYFPKGYSENNPCDRLPAAGSDASGVILLADAIKNNGALMKLTFGDKQALTMTTEMTEANFRGKLQSHEAQIVAAFLPKCT
jgi:hypothetical protein